jgi:hypothetical protein
MPVHYAISAAGHDDDIGKKSRNQLRKIAAISPSQAASGVAGKAIH